jgi:hypothetical protein
MSNYESYKPKQNEYPRIVPSTTKRYERPNHIPYKFNRTISRKQWNKHYKTQIIDIYRIIRGLISEKYEIDWDDSKIFNNLSKLIFHCSSRHIDHYAEKDLEQYESKNSD